MVSLAVRSRLALDARSRRARCRTHLQLRTAASLDRIAIAQLRNSPLRSRNAGALSPSPPPTPTPPTPPTTTTTTTPTSTSTSSRPCRRSSTVVAAASVASSEQGDSPPLNSKDIAPSPPSSPTLVLYSKKGCPLCQGLEEKVRAAFARGAFLPGSRLRGCGLEVRDIETSAEWNARFAMEVPVLFWRRGGGSGGGGGENDGDETPVPRSPPRVTVEKLSSTLEAAIPPTPPPPPPA